MPRKPAAKAPELPPKPWPRLSADLPKHETLHRCRACGATEKLARWQEHDEEDKPEPVVVVLCEACSGKIIEPHPRLYRELPRFEPFPGAMGICTFCRFMTEPCRCSSPQAKINGGPGLKYEMPPPDNCHVLYTEGGRRKGKWLTTFKGPVTGCTGREPKQ